MLKKFTLNFKLIKGLDFKLLLTLVTIILFGILNIYLCTKGGNFHNPFSYAKKQFLWFLISLVALYFMLTFDYKAIWNYVHIIYFISIILLICVWIPGIGTEVNGGQGWINLKVCLLQPSEIAKFALILMLAKLIDEMDCDINNVKNLLKLGVYVGIPVILILIQKDMGMTMVCFFIVLGILFMAGLSNRIIMGGFITLILSILILWNSGLIYDHQKARILEFLNAESDITGNGYQLYHGTIGVGNGGVLGNKLILKPGESSGYAATYVPEIQTDFIFTAIAEQWGLVGWIFLSFLYGFLIIKILNISRHARDTFGSLIAIGMASYLIFAITQNIGMTIGVLPITGITLPFISYGGSSLLTTTVAMGAVLNVGINRKKINF